MQCQRLKQDGLCKHVFLGVLQIEWIAFQNQCMLCWRQCHVSVKRSIYYDVCCCHLDNHASNAKCCKLLVLNMGSNCVQQNHEACSLPLQTCGRWLGDSKSSCTRSQTQSMLHSHFPVTGSCLAQCTCHQHQSHVI